MRIDYFQFMWIILRTGTYQLRRSQGLHRTSMDELLHRILEPHVPRFLVTPPLMEMNLTSYFTDFNIYTKLFSVTFLTLFPMENCLFAFENEIIYMQKCARNVDTSGIADRHRRFRQPRPTRYFHSILRIVVSTVFPTLW